MTSPSQFQTLVVVLRSGRCCSVLIFTSEEDSMRSSPPPQPSDSSKADVRRKRKRDTRNVWMNGKSNCNRYIHDCSSSVTVAAELRAPAEVCQWPMFGKIWFGICWKYEQPRSPTTQLQKHFKANFQPFLPSAVETQNITHSKLVQQHF